MNSIRQTGYNPTIEINYVKHDLKGFTVTTNKEKQDLDRHNFLYPTPRYDRYSVHTNNIIVEGSCIRVHPKLIPVMKPYIEQKSKDCIFRPFGINLIPDESLSETIFYIAKKQYQPDRFCTWFEDLNDVPEWAYYMGAVKVANFIKCNNSTEVIKNFSRHRTFAKDFMNDGRKRNY